MYHDLLVHVDGSSAGRRRVQFAITLARRMGARLSGIHVTPPPEVPLKFKPSQIAKAASEISLKLASDARAAAALFDIADMPRRFAGQGHDIPAQDGVLGSGEFQRREDMGAERRVRLRDCNRTIEQRRKILPDVKPLPLAADEDRDRRLLRRSGFRQLGRCG